MGPHAHRKRRTSRDRGALRVGALRALIVAVGLLFLQGPRLFHLLLVAHTTCEHGDLVEVEAPAAPATEQLGAEAASSDQGSIRAAHGEPGGHDHCDALALRHLPAEVGEALIAPSIVSFALPPARELGEERRPVPLLALAPKSSPPLS